MPVPEDVGFSGVFSTGLGANFERPLAAEVVFSMGARRTGTVRVGGVGAGEGLGRLSGIWVS
ncbi:hypothetical protein BH24ACT1_BH24ACT1_06000 [soil metagenome]